MAIISINGYIGSGKDTVGKIIQYLDWYKAASNQDLSPNLTFEEWSKIKTIQYPFNHTPWEIKKFAGKLKQIVALLTGCTVEDLESQEFKMKELGPEWNTYGIVRKEGIERQVAIQPTPHLKDSIWLAAGDNRQVENILTYRKLLQVIGTDALRNVVHENIWVNALMSDYKPLDDTLRSSMGNVIDYSACPYPNWIITDLRFPNEAKAVEKRGGITIRVNRDNGTRAIDLNPHPSETSLDSHKFDYIIENDGSLEDLVNKVRGILQKENII